MDPSSSSSRASRWGRVGLNYDKEEAANEQDKFRAEFAVVSARIGLGLSFSDSPREEAEDFPYRASEVRPETVRDVLGDGSLKKRVLAVTAKAGRSTKCAWGETAKVRGCVRVKVREQEEVKFEGALAIGAVDVPYCISVAAATMAVGERASFEVAAALCFDDTQFDYAGSPRWAHAMLAGSGPPPLLAQVDPRQPLTMELEILECDVSDLMDVSGSLGAGVVLKEQSKPTDWRRPSARAVISYDCKLYAPRPQRFRLPGMAQEEEAENVLLEAITGIISSAAAFAEEAEEAETALRHWPIGLRRSLRFLLESLASGEECTATIRSRRIIFVKGDLENTDSFPELVVCEVKSLGWLDYEDCSPERPGSVRKKVTSSTTASFGRVRKQPRDFDNVTVRGLVRLASDPSVIVCSLGGEVSSSSEGAAATWRLDEDDHASLSWRPMTSSGIKVPLCRGLELAVKSLDVGEIAEFDVSADFGFVRPPPSATPPEHKIFNDIAAYHYSPCYATNLPAEAFGVALTCKLQLAACSKMDDDDAMELVRELKDLGNSHFGSKAFSRAARRYSEALCLLENHVEKQSLPGLSDPMLRAHEGATETDDDKRGVSASAARAKEAQARAEKAEHAQQLRVTLLRNRAACDLKRANYTRCRADCDATLELFPADLKALYRLGLAHVALRDIESAKSAFKKCLKVDARCAQAKTGLKQIAELEQQLDDKHQNLKGGSFGKRDQVRRNAPPPKPVDYTDFSLDEAEFIMPKELREGAFGKKSQE